MSNPTISSQTFSRLLDPPLGGSELRIHAYGHSTNPAYHYENRHPQEDTWLFLHFYQEVDVNLSGLVRRYPALTWLYWAPGQRRAYGNSQGSWRHSFLHASGARLSAILTGLGLRAAHAFAIDDEAATFKFLCDLNQEAERLQPDQRILGNLCENWLRTLARSVVNADAAIPERLALVRDKLVDGSAAWLSLSALASLAGLSTSHFSAEFLRHFAISPGKFQLIQRIERAKRLLRIRSLRIATVAEQIGYADSYSFSKAFRKCCGQSPQAWRRASSSASINDAPDRGGFRQKNGGDASAGWFS